MSKIGIIYKLVSTDINIKEIYIGSTCNFRTRKCHHKGRCNNETDKNYNLNVYKYIRANGGWDTFDMIQIEEVKHDTKQQLHTRERYWIEELKATLNRVIPTRTPAEYVIDNIDNVRQNKIKFNNNNRVFINAKAKEHYQKNKENIRIRQSKKYDCKCGSISWISNKSLHEKTKKHKNWLLTQ